MDSWTKRSEATLASDKDMVGGGGGGVICHQITNRRHHIPILETVTVRNPVLWWERALAPCQCLLSKHQAFTVQLWPDSWSGAHQWAWQQISVKALWRSHSKNLHRQTLDIPAVQQTPPLHPGTDQYWTMLSLQLANFWTALFGKHSEKSFICDLGTIPWQVQNLFRRTGNLVNCALSVCSKKKEKLCQCAWSFDQAEQSELFIITVKKHSFGSKLQNNCDFHRVCQMLQSISKNLCSLTQNILPQCNYSHLNMRKSILPEDRERKMIK